MICAISPAALNYEESLSTLRYADRAKKIINKAVVNESIQDKLIRELRSENDKLKKILMDAAKKGKGIIDLSELGLGDASEIVEQMEEAEQRITDIEKPWEERLAEQRAKDEEERKFAEEQKQQDLLHHQLKNKKMPHLTNLDEDPQLTGKVYYCLAELNQKNVHIGKQGGNPEPIIKLSGAGVLKNHGFFKIEKNGQIKLCVNGQEASELTLVNGVSISKSPTPASAPDKKQFYSVQSDNLLDFGGGENKEDPK